MQVQCPTWPIDLFPFGAPGPSLTPVNTARLRPHDFLAPIAGLLLLTVMLALAWFRSPASGLDGGGSANAFESFDIVDIALVLAASVAIALPLLGAGLLSSIDPRAHGRLLVVVGLLAAAVVALRILAPAEITVETVSFEGITDSKVEAVRGVGLYVGFAASAGIAAAGLWRTQAWGGGR